MSNVNYVDVSGTSRTALVDILSTSSIDHDYENTSSPANVDTFMRIESPTKLIQSGVVENTKKFSLTPGPRKADLYPEKENDNRSASVTLLNSVLYEAIGTPLNFEGINNLDKLLLTEDKPYSHLYAHAEETSVLIGEDFVSDVEEPKAYKFKPEDKEDIGRVDINDTIDSYSDLTVKRNLFPDQYVSATYQPRSSFEAIRESVVEDLSALDLSDSLNQSSSLLGGGNISGMSLLSRSDPAFSVPSSPIKHNMRYGGHHSRNPQLTSSGEWLPSALAPRMNYPSQPSFLEPQGGLTSGSMAATQQQQQMSGAQLRWSHDGQMSHQPGLKEAYNSDAAASSYRSGVASHSRVPSLDLPKPVPTSSSGFSAVGGVVSATVSSAGLPPLHQTDEPVIRGSKSNRVGGAAGGGSGSYSSGVGRGSGGGSLSGRNNYMDEGSSNSGSSNAYGTGSNNGPVRSSSGGRYGRSDTTSTSGSVRGSKDFNKQSQQQNSSSSGGGVSGSGSAVATSSSTAALRQSQMESPRSKALYKDFIAEFREREKESVPEALKLADAVAATVSDGIRWKVHLEQADLAKRHNMIQEARHYFMLVCKSQPYSALGYLEWSKMEEENGRLHRSLGILMVGLKVSRVQEALVSRVIKLQERLHNYDEVRALLGSLGTEAMEKVWKSVMEGALFEARIGNVDRGRMVLKYLMGQMSWYGPIYYEAFRLEEKESDDLAALEIIRVGLAELPRYAPLWFGWMRIAERKDTEKEAAFWRSGYPPKLEELNKVTSDAVKQISKELTWKVYFEKSQVEERLVESVVVGYQKKHPKLSLQECRNQLLVNARESLMKSLLLCPANLRWKVLLVGSRLELSVGAISTCKELLKRAFLEVPFKSKSFVFLECSRLEEFLGNIDTARDILARARVEVSGEWKIHLESVLLEARCGDLRAAIVAAKKAVALHPGTGRLWSIYIQLLHRTEQRHLPLSSLSQSEETKEAVLLAAITQVPKSGEVWTERARCHLNPLQVASFDLCLAQRSFSFAIQFTPQYGDTFVEYVRLEMLCQVLLPKVLEALHLPLLPFLKTHLTEDLESDVVDLVMLTSERYEVGVSVDPFYRQNRRRAIDQMQRLLYDFDLNEKDFQAIVIKSLTRRCVNADPNYGSAWFHYREQPNLIPTAILTTSMERIAKELVSTQRLYGRAVVEWVLRCMHSQMTTYQAAPTAAVSSSSSSSGVGEATESGVTSPWRLTKSSSNNPVKFASPVKDSRLNLLQEYHSIKDKQEHDAQKARVLDFCADVEVHMKTRDALLMSPAAVKSSGKVNNETEKFSSEDFVSGSIELNRELFSQDLSEEIKRKYLFGSDQIIS